MMWHRSLLDTIEQARERGMCLYGAGFWGEVTYKILSRMGYIPLCFCDDSEEKWNRQYQGLQVYSLEDAANKYPDAIFIVCKEGRKISGHNPLEFKDMISRLKEYGVYDSHSELRVSMYRFLLEIGKGDLPASFHEEKEEAILEGDVKNLLLFNHMSRSGSWYLEQLLDGHPDILTLPYSTNIFTVVYEKRLQYLEDEELLIEMSAQMVDYFHSLYEKKFMGKGRGLYGDQVINEHGDFIYDVLIYPDEFMEYLRLQFSGRKICLDSLGHMMRIYAAAYGNCLGKKKKDSGQEGFWFLYHMHEINWDVAKAYEYFNKDEFRRIENLFIIREPIQQLYSFLRYTLNKRNANLWIKGNESFSHVMKSEMGLMLEKRQGIDNVMAVRLEDLKLYPYGTMAGVCGWLNIKYHDSLSKTTLNGIQVYYPAATENGFRYITGNDTMTVERKDFSEYLTLWDEARLNIVYAKFKRAFGYQNDVPDFTEFDEEMLECLLKKDFKFADKCQKLAVKNGDVDASFNINKFVKNLYMEYMREYRDETVYYGYIKPVRD